MVRVVRGLAVSGATLAACLVVLELGLRLTVGPVAPSNETLIPRGLIQDTDLPGVRYVLRPNASGVQQFASDPRGYFDRGAMLTYHVNSLGFRGVETTKEKPAGVFRVVAVGDSVLFGTGVREPDVMTAVLQRELVSGGMPCEVLNFGVMGYDTFEEAVLFRRVAVRFDPDLGIVCFFLNDTKAGTALSAFNDTGKRSFLRRTSVLWDHVAARFARAAAVEQLVQDYERGFADNYTGWIRAQQALQKALEPAERRRIPMVLVIFPLLFRLDDYPFADIHAKVAAAAKAMGYHVLDLLPSFSGQDGPALWVDPSNQHPNELAHAITGRALARFLVDEGLVGRR